MGASRHRIWFWLLVSALAILSILASSAHLWPAPAARPTTTAPGVPEIAEVQTMEDLEAVAPIRLERGVEVRLGLNDGGEDAGPWRLLYCLKKRVALDTPGDVAAVPTVPLTADALPLGPVMFTVTAEMLKEVLRAAAGVWHP